MSLVHPIYLRYYWWRFVRRIGMARRDSAKDWTWLNNDGMRVRLRWPFASVSLSSVPVCCVFRERDELLKINITLKLENGPRAAPLQAGKQSERVDQFCDDLAELQKTSLLLGSFPCPCPFCFRFLFFPHVSFLPLLRSITIHSYKFLFVLCRSTQSWPDKRYWTLGQCFVLSLGPKLFNLWRFLYIPN